jgi:hypothetical protein
MECILDRGLVENGFRNDRLVNERRDEFVSEQDEQDCANYDGNGDSHGDGAKV